MMNRYFKLKPLKTAKIAEISEATAASPIPEEERINFHIGHPVQDARLLQRYFELVSGSTSTSIGSSAEQEQPDDRETHWPFLFEALKKSSPYMPRGGFTIRQPGELITLLQEWLTLKQPDPIDYDNGQKSGQKEIMIGSGGLWEMLRVFFFTLDRYLLCRQASLATFQTQLPGHLQSLTPFEFFPLPEEEETAIAVLESYFQDHPQRPLFLILGQIASERMRRQLRTIGLNHPLFFIEINNAPNHLSLAREAKMAGRVLRFLTPAIFSPHFSDMALTFVLGNYEYIHIMETVHFELKGTPSASEAALLTYLLKNSAGVSEHVLPIETGNRTETVQTDRHLDAFFHYPESILNRGTEIIADKTMLWSSALNRIRAKQDIIEQQLYKIRVLPLQPVDTLADLTAAEVLERFMQNIDNPQFAHQLADNFLAAFLQHHPEYRRDHCVAVSGSARTALGLLGFHCGIGEVVSADLSWTYEHCFPRVTSVSLQPSLELDAQAMLEVVTRRLESEDDWNNRAAVVINNPHNASGKVFDQATLQHLLVELLRRRIRVIDDLSYQNVAPQDDPVQIPTLRQTVNELIRNGYLTEQDSRYLISVHSLSKTDSFAGARLAVVEIADAELRDRFNSMVGAIVPNRMALLLAYLFYRNYPEQLQVYWHLRNTIFRERSEALRRACSDLPADRNPFGIEIRRPEGSMYPQMIIHELPAGISLDWLAAQLAIQGIGLVPLSTFARTDRGFELARKTFRLTLGGSAGAEKLYRQTRRVLIDLNRRIAREASRYNKQTLGGHPFPAIKQNGFFNERISRWNDLIQQAGQHIPDLWRQRINRFNHHSDSAALQEQFQDAFLPQRLKLFRERFKEKMQYAGFLLQMPAAERRNRLQEILSHELYKEDLQNRQSRFRKRLFDRTVHPTQMYALQVDNLIDRYMGQILRDQPLPADGSRLLGAALVDEFFGYNIALTSTDEAEELLLDLHLCIEAEEFSRWSAGKENEIFLSFWGDWDGSTRPSGQGHRLVAAVVMDSVATLADMVLTLQQHAHGASFDSALLAEIEYLPRQQRRFWKVLNDITLLTNQLEKRYRTVLPYSLPASSSRKLAVRLHLARDPLTVLWQHNDRLERKMLELRRRRREGLEYYFALNKRLRKALYERIPLILDHLDHPEILFRAGLYRSKLHRFVLTPRIHQKLITSEDSFAIDTTVFNITEINAIAGRYGHPGMILGLQVSMASDPDALIALDRKLRAQREQALRDHRPGESIAGVWCIPLFEDDQTIHGIEQYLDKIWAYATRSRRIQQDVAERFSEIICELFFAGSDLSQQISQPVGAALYARAKFTVIRWLAEHGLIETTRIKLGSGEPMQRQGGYYNPLSGEAAFLSSKDARNRLNREVKASTQKSTEYARSPMMGVLSSGDFRTLQSNFFERLRFFNQATRADIFYHMRELQHYHDGELIRASEPLQDTRLQFKERGLSELQQLTQGSTDPFYDQYLHYVQSNFRQILYGREEDVIGIHVISYFIARSIPALRDRPSIRPTREITEQAGQQVIRRIAQTLPLAGHGSLLRAIDHNRAQSMILGINQLTTGLFRALQELQHGEGRQGDFLTAITERILPRLPVYEILHTLRLYHDRELKYLSEMEALFPAGNSVFLALREDIDAIELFAPLFQKELLRRHGLDIFDFFDEDGFNPNLLPCLRPDLAVLLQRNLFNTREDQFFRDIPGKVDGAWREQVRERLGLPEKLQAWREEIWQLIRHPIQQQVASFVQLATAVNKLTAGKGYQELPFSASPGNIEKLGSSLKEALRGVVDDSMRQFLQAAVHYLTQLPKMTADVPIDIIRALRDVQRIVQMEGQALTPQQQEVLRFYVLQMARLAGENG